VSPRRRAYTLIAMLLLAAAGAVHSSAQLIAMGIYSLKDDASSLTRAAQIDPGNYELQLRLARGGRQRQRCTHARAAHALYPSAAAARELSRRCGS
jgi:hypothetical protein